MNTLNHIAFIMDGNGRWGKKTKQNRNFGHLKGVETVKKIVKGSTKLNIKYLTFFVFSTENWRRPKSEIKYLFSLIISYFTKELEDVIENGIRVRILGNTNKFPIKLKKILKNTENKTKYNKKIYVNLAINYGSRDELIKSFNKLKKKKKISEKMIDENLYTKEIPDPDILIRTGGKQRLSNFLLWQLAYTELFFVNKLWPEFNIKDLKKIILKYKKIKRNFGAI